MRFDDVISELGEFGRYQKRLYFLVCIVAIPDAMNILGPIFTLLVPNHRCAIPGLDNDTYQSQGSWHDDLVNCSIPWSDSDEAYSKCRLYKTDDHLTNETRKCDRWVYEKDPFRETFVTDVRTKIAFINNFLWIIPKYCWGSFLAFLFKFHSTCFTSFRSCMELVGPSKRKYAGVVIQIFWCIGIFLQTGLAFGTREWRHLQMSICAGTVLLFSYWWLVPESPRWLINKGRLEEASDVIKKAAKVNKVTLSEKVSSLQEIELDGQGEKIWHMFTTPTLIIRSGIIFFNCSKSEWINVVLALVGRFGASAAFAVIYIYSAELFPTVMRNSGMGVSSVCARIGGILAPFVGDLGSVLEGDIAVALPLIVFGGLCLTAGLLDLLLPETLNRKLPDTVEDAKNFGRSVELKISKHFSSVRLQYSPDR
ncbi:solute carrier family 22 member 1-like [Aplysia californica]|uniref:Solute carrier family 22 member 1-like n=1 Tax=Aplysia californica TaxID=6500 RepID=A0ABM1VT69_APLCA|nr:solute carrier family 22 member 1-like [Aplysia californica]